MVRISVEGIYNLTIPLGYGNKSYASIRDTKALALLPRLLSGLLNRCQ
jgi:hypothetical protein